MCCELFAAGLNLVSQITRSLREEQEIPNILTEESVVYSDILFVDALIHIESIQHGQSACHSEQNLLEGKYINCAKSPAKAAHGSELRFIVYEVLSQRGNRFHFYVRHHAHV